MSSERHQSVLFQEVLNLASVAPGETVCDCTLGLGGHAFAFAEAIGPEGTLIAFDADAENLESARERLSQSSATIDLRHTNFGSIAQQNLPQLDVLFADLGLSSPHLDEPERGFSFRADGPLDLRFDRTQGTTAAEWIGFTEERQIMNVLRKYGELKEAPKLSRFLHERKPQTTFELKDIVEEACGYRAKDRLPQVFQALRMAINDEEGSLLTLLEYGPKLLKPGGRLLIISFHSLEDRPVKQVFRKLCTGTIDETTGQTVQEAPFELLTKKPVIPREEEIEQNPRSRSAKLRAIRKRLPSS